MTLIDLTAQLNEMYDNGFDYDLIMREANDIAEKNRWLTIGDKQRTGILLRYSANSSRVLKSCHFVSFIPGKTKSADTQKMSLLSLRTDITFNPSVMRSPLRYSPCPNLVSEDTCATCLETIPEPLYVIQFLCDKNGWTYTVDSDRNYTYWDYASDGKNLLTSNETEFCVTEDGSEDDNIKQ